MEERVAGAARRFDGNGKFSTFPAPLSRARRYSFRDSSRLRNEVPRICFRPHVVPLRQENLGYGLVD